MAFDTILPGIICPGGTTVYRIALFQSGLGQNELDFDDLLKNVRDYYLNDEHNNNDNLSSVLYYEKILDMGFFNCETGAFEDSTAKDTFDSTIEDIVNFARRSENAGKTIAVKTYLNRVVPSETQRLHDVLNLNYSEPMKNSSFNYDSIENQKNKLVYIIDALKNCEQQTRLMLVGHSQGGLVNMEAAIERPEDIVDLVSISTPYAPVYFAKIASILEGISNLFGGSVFSMTSPHNVAPLDVIHGYYYRKSLQVLASDDYFALLKQKWNDLSNRPMLTVMVSVAGLLDGSIANPLSPENESFSLTEKKAFDGLVMLDEMIDITHADIIRITENLVGCNSNGQIADTSCINQGYTISNCYENCCLPRIGLLDALLQSIISYFSWEINKINENGVVTKAEREAYFNELPLIKAIEAGVTRSLEESENNQNEGNYETTENNSSDSLEGESGEGVGLSQEDLSEYISDFMDYYNLYASDYSHAFVHKTNPKVIQKINDLLTIF